MCNDNCACPDRGHAQKLTPTQIAHQKNVAASGSRKAEQDRYKRAMMAQVQRERQEAESPGADAAESLDFRYLRGELATAGVSQDGQAVLLSALSSLAELRGVTRDRLKELGLPMRDRRPVIMLQKRLEKDADGGGDSV